MPYLGGLEIVSVSWIDTHSIAVRISTTYTDKLYQLYAGRSLVGVTSGYSDTVIIGTVVPALWPEHLQVLAVNSDEINNDYGSALPDRPYNRAKVTATVAGWTDAKYLDVTAGTTVGGAVSDSNLIYREFFDTNRVYEMIVPAVGTFEGSGTWNLEAVGRDDKETGGNLGTPQALSVDVLSHPPDVPLQSDGTRFTVSIDSSVATFNFTEVA